MTRTNEQIAHEIALDYTLTLTAKNPEHAQLLEQAIRRGIVARMADPFEWVVNFEQRELDEIEYALYYIRKTSPTLNPGHGTEGHNRLVLIAKFATALGYTLVGPTQLLHDGKPTNERSKT